MTRHTSFEATHRDLNRLLCRLEQRLILATPTDPELRRLRKSVYERNKVNAVYAKFFSRVSGVIADSWN